MRRTLISIQLIILALQIFAQEEVIVEGSVSYITSQSVYAKFISTENISAGDTLFINPGGSLIPALVVRQSSSISCVCDVIAPYEPKEGDKVFSRKIVFLAVPAGEPTPVNIKAEEIFRTQPDTLAADERQENKAPRQLISGRLSASSYLNFSNSPAGNSQRMRYTFSLDARNLGGTKLSAETYVSFVHRPGEWNEIRDNIFNGLKIYSLAFRYDFSENSRILLGRKINPRISSLGAVDGIQFERSFRNFTIGAFLGTRPDYDDYSFNPDLFQYGVYLSHSYRSDKGDMQSTLAFVEQDNNWNTDRRFLYLQHANAIIKNLYLFGSAELDLYSVSDSTPQNTFSLTNLYLMLRYQVIKELSLSFTYSARNNIIYYETYKDIVERLLETETLQGFRLQLNYRPVKHLSVGVTGNYRYRQQDPKQSRNLYGYVTYSMIPVLNISATLSATWMETVYISGRIYSAGIMRDLMRGRLQAGLNYRYVDYNFYESDTPLVQHYGEVNLSCRIYKKLSLSAYYEGAFDKENTFNRVYFNITQRF